MTAPSPGRRMRDLLAAPGILICPGIYDGFSGQLVESMAFSTAAVFQQSLAEERVIDRPDLPVPFGELNALMRHANIKAQEARFVNIGTLKAAE